MLPFEVPIPPLRPDGPPLWATALIPVVGSLGTLALVVSGGHRQLIIGAGLMMATLGAMALQICIGASGRRRQTQANRARYRVELDHARRQLSAYTRVDQRLPVTLGKADRLVEFADDVDDPQRDPVCRAARERFVAAYSVLHGEPYIVDLSTTPLIIGDPAHCRATVLRAAEAHPPETLGIEVRSRSAEAWSWVALLPHHAARGAHTLIVIDGTGRPPLVPNTTVIEVGSPCTTEYAPALCGPAEATTRARRLGAATPPTVGRSVPWRPSLGVGGTGTVRLDLREAADGGVGPHGLLIGATGSGKSELLRHLISELVATHPSDELRLALVDYKGGATFSIFAALPHVAAYVTNLADPGSTHRLHESLEGELIRRQRELAAAGAASIRDHPMARLLIVIDEFAELLAEDALLAELFSRIGRLGRSLGIHLLLSTQRLEEGRLHGLEAHLSYRIAMRTFTAAESRLAIGSSLAAELGQRPGAGVLAAGGELRRFQAPDPARRTSESGHARVLSLRPAPGPGPTVLEDRVRRARGAPAPSLWLPPLDAPPRLPDLAPAAPLHATFGVIDRPREQRIDPLTLDLSGAGGHVAVVGGPRSGKSTALRSIAASLRRSTPDIRLIGLDLTSGLAGALPPERLATARTPARVDRLLRHLRRLTDERASPPIAVLVDSWSAMRDHYPWTDALHQIAERGLAADIHLIVAAHRWSDLRPAVRDLFGSRIELRLGDPLESEIDRRLAAGVPTKPGHGLIAPGYAIQLAIDS